MSISKPICIIPAKGASTRLAKKNILKICGKSTINYVIEAAIKSNLFSKIIVSTESEEVIDIIEQHNIIVHKREEYLAHDPYGVVDVVMDVLNTYPSFKKNSDFCILLPTSPLIEDTDIINVYLHYKSSHFDVVFTLSKSPHSAFRTVTIENTQIKPIFKENMLKKSQDLEQTYDINAAITVLNMKKFLKNKSYFSDNIGAYVLAQEKAVDIDTIFDFEFATFLMQKRLENENWNS